MTETINKQALREKFEAWAEEAGALPWGILKQHRNQDGSYPGPHYTYMWNAWDACHEALLDELEAAEKRIAGHDRQCDEQYLLGMRAGWNFCTLEDDAGFDAAYDARRKLIDAAGIITRVEE
ncbi:hypothetical protein D3C75_598790 [compost metagenome]